MPAVLPLHRREPRPVLRVAAYAIVYAALTVGTTPAAAQPNQAFELDWLSPSDCPQQGEVTEQIRTMLGAAPGTTLPSGLHAKGVIDTVDDRFRLTLSVRVGQTERARVIVSNDCTSLGKAAAVVLGLLIRRERESGRELSDSDLGSDFQPSARTAPPPPTAKPVETSAPLQTHDVPNQRRWHLLVMAPSATLDYFTLPTPELGIGAGLGIQHDTWRWFLSATLWRNARKAQEGLEAYEARFARKSFETWIGRGWRSDTLELSPCILAAIDVLDASATGDRLTTEPRRIVLASAGAGLVAFWHVTDQIGFFLAGTARIALRRSVFVVQPTILSSEQQAHSVPWGTVLTSIGSEWIF